MARKFILLGASCVGKGFTMSTLKDLRDNSLVGMGDYFWNFRRQDPVFDRNYGVLYMDKGELVPDEITMFHLFNRILPAIESSNATLDGICRTSGQVREMQAKLELGQEDAIFVLNATKDVCWQRYLDRIKKNPNGKRTDEGTFEKRFNLHQGHVPTILHTAKRGGTKIIPINANQPLEKFASEIKTAISCLIAGEQPKLTKVFQLTPNFSMLPTRQMAAA